MKKKYRIFIILGCLLTTTLSGCKPSAELGEVLINFGYRISSKIIGEMIQQTFNSFYNQKVPFTLKQGERYEKIESNQNYYIVHRLNGTTEHYSMEGVLLWSSSTQQLNQDQVSYTQNNQAEINNN